MKVNRIEFELKNRHRVACGLEKTYPPQDSNMKFTNYKLIAKHLKEVVFSIFLAYQDERTFLEAKYMMYYTRKRSLFLIILLFLLAKIS